MHDTHSWPVERDCAMVSSSTISWSRTAWWTWWSHDVADGDAVSTIHRSFLDISPRYFTNIQTLMQRAMTNRKLDEHYKEAVTETKIVGKIILFSQNVLHCNKWAEWSARIWKVHDTRLRLSKMPSQRIQRIWQLWISQLRIWHEPGPFAPLAWILIVC